MGEKEASWYIANTAVYWKETTRIPKTTMVGKTNVGLMIKAIRFWQS